MYNQAPYSKKAIKRLLEEDFFSEAEMKVLIGFYSLENCEATTPKLAKYLGYEHFSPINSIVGKMGKRVAKELDISLRKRADGTEAGWDIICEGESQEEGFLWRLKKPMVEACRESGLERMEKDILTTEELPKGHELHEGSKQTITVNRYERNNLARSICLDKYGFECRVCGFDFEEKYGETGKEFIHVHHITPISEIGKEYKVNGETDLIPVCANCHAMIHRRKNQPLTIEALKEKIKTTANKL